jgi:hypothetical protein
MAAPQLLDERFDMRGPSRRGAFARATFCLIVASSPLFARFAKAQSSTAELAPLPEQLRLQFEGRLATIDQLRADEAAIESRIAASNGVLRAVLEIRVERDRLARLEQGVEFAERVATREKEFAVGQFHAAAVDVLQANLGVAEDVWERLRQRVVFPDASLDAATQAAANGTFFQNTDKVDRVIALTAEGLRLLRGFGIDVEEREAAFRERLRERAINASVYLDMAQDEAAGIQAALDALPGDKGADGQERDSRGPSRSDCEVVDSHRRTARSDRAGHFLVSTTIGRGYG